MKKYILILALCVVIGASVFAGVFYYQNLRGIKPAITKPPANIVDLFEQSAALPPGANDTAFPLRLPDGFEIGIFGKDLSSVRVMAFDSRGNLWVSRTKEGIVTMLDVDDGQVVGQADIFTGRRNPHGLAFNPASPDELFIAEQDKISRVVVYREDAKSPANGGHEGMTDIEEVQLSLRLYSSIVPAQITDLPANSSDRHYTRTIGFGADGRLYVSIGSTCDVCVEESDQVTRILSMNPDGTDKKEFARGLRNAVFFAWSPFDGRMWVTEMGRDKLGDELPPDEINIVEEGKNYGWPMCYGKNIHDTVFDKNTYIRNPCMEPFETGSHIDLPAHSAPLGLAFVPESWGEAFRNDLIIAYHGSWNKSDPTGYKLSWIRLDETGGFESEEDFIAGWLTADDKALGRPVDLKFGPDGMLYVSDDRAGVIYQVRYYPMAPADDVPATGMPPQVFQPTPAPTEPVAAGGCRASGCSGQICADEEMMSNCEYRPEYACYQTARCERQADGECGWTQTAALAACLSAGGTVSMNEMRMMY